MKLLVIVLEIRMSERMGETKSYDIRAPKAPTNSSLGKAVL